MEYETNIDTVAQFFDAVRSAGVWIDDKHITAEGEGRATRYLVDGESATKGDARGLFDSARDSGAAVLVGDEGGQKVQCEVCGGFVGYLTGSHMGTHEDGEPQTVAEYREAFGEDAPLAPEGFMEALAEANRERWEAGEYDHLRGENGDNGAAEA